MTDQTVDIYGIVRDPTGQFLGTGSDMELGLGVHGEQHVSDIHGKWFAANYRGNVYHAAVTAQTVPVIASGLVSVFTIYNPPSSGYVAELISVDIGQVLATTVVDAVGWYSSSAALTALGTFTTLGVARSGRLQDPVGNRVKFYSAYTHSGTPIREEIIGSFGGVTDIGMTQIQKRYEGELIVPPGIAMSVAMSTAVGFTSGLDISARWAEWKSA